jgi:hypothetical protein
MLTAPTAAQANTRLIVPEEIYRLCDRRQFTRSEIRKIQKRSDYELILRYTADQCAGVASVLGDGATASLPGSSGGAGGAAGLAGGAAVTRTAGTSGGASGGAAQCVPGLGLANSCDPICDRQEFTTREIRAIQRSADFPAILEWTLDACPAVAAVLTNTATATTATEPDRRGGGGDLGGGTGGGDTGTGGGDTGTGGGDTGTGGGDTGTGGGDTGTGGGDTGTGGGDTGTGGSRPPEPDANTDPDGYDHWRDTYGPGSGWNGN